MWQTSSISCKCCLTWSTLISMLESANHNVIGDNAALAVHPTRYRTSSKRWVWRKWIWKWGSSKKVCQSCLCAERSAYPVKAEYSITASRDVAVVKWKGCCSHQKRRSVCAGCSPNVWFEDQVLMICEKWHIWKWKAFSNIPCVDAHFDLIFEGHMLFLITPIVTAGDVCGIQCGWPPRDFRVSWQDPSTVGCVKWHMHPSDGGTHWLGETCVMCDWWMLFFDLICCVEILFGASSTGYF